MPSMKEMIASKKYHLQYFSTRSVSQEIVCMLENLSCFFCHLLIFIAPLLKSGGYIGFGLSVIPSVRPSIRPSIIISFPLNIFRTLLYNLSKFCMYIDIDMI